MKKSGKILVDKLKAVKDDDDHDDDNKIVKDDDDDATLSERIRTTKFVKICTTIYALL